eukprot:2531828-Amphidinium_carterae.1
MQSETCKSHFNEGIIVTLPAGHPSLKPCMQPPCVLLINATTLSLSLASSYETHEGICLSIRLSLTNGGFLGYGFVTRAQSHFNTTLVELLRCNVTLWMNLTWPWASDATHALALSINNCHWQVLGSSHLLL